jgi:tripartite ATP-independent transporter DctM subunit
MIGVIGLIFSLILIVSGMPIAFALLITGVLFTGHIRGTRTAFSMLGREIYGNSGEFVWATVAFFVLMGYFCLHSRFGEDLYVLFNRWIGRMRGGLAMATAASCTGFAAIVGDSISSIATMTAIAMPQMKKYNYDDRLSTGSIAGGSIVGPVIPPSIPFIIYGVLTQVSIGKLFIAGIIPGLLFGIAFILTVSIWCRINPTLGPPGEKSEWREKISSLTAAGPIAGLFVIVIGGIYGGVFSVCEGGAIGAAGALIIGLIMRRYTWKSFFQSLLETAKVLSMVLLIMNGAMLFTRFVAWCNLSGQVTELFSKTGLSSGGVVFLILLTFFLLGFIVDILTLTVIGVPILHPVAVAQGADPLWFATLVVLVMILGSLTPPIGINLFTMKGMAKDIPMATIYKGAMPFVLATIVVIAVVFAIPSLVTWLPNLFR